MTEIECQKFFALGKRVPKDVKRFCGICRQHGVLEETRGHVCTYKNCLCNKCQLVRTRRQIMSKQIRLRRAQDKRFQRTNEPADADVVPIKLINEELASIVAYSKTNLATIPASPDELLRDAGNMCYFCQKCKNHDILQHKRQCPFTDCTCDKCDLIETRRRLDQHIKKRRASMKASAISSPCNEDVTLPQKNLDSCSIQTGPIINETNSNFVQQDLRNAPEFQLTTSTIPFFIPQTDVPTHTFPSVVTTTPFNLSQSDLLAMIMANMNAQSYRCGISQANQIDMSQTVKTLTPPMSLAISPLQADISIPQPQISMKEIEQLLILKYQMHQMIQ